MCVHRNRYTIWMVFFKFNLLLVSTCYKLQNINLLGSLYVVKSKQNKLMKMWLKLVNFDTCCVFWLAYEHCTNMKADRNTFFWLFQSFLLILCFNNFSPENIKTSENSVFSYSWKLVDTQTLVYSLINFIFFIKFFFCFGLFSSFLVN